MDAAPDPAEHFADFRELYFAGNGPAFELPEWITDAAERLFTAAATGQQIVWMTPRRYGRRAALELADTAMAQWLLFREAGLNADVLILDDLEGPLPTPEQRRVCREWYESALHRISG